MVLLLISFASKTRGLLSPILCHPSLHTLGKYTFEAYMLQFHASEVWKSYPPMSGLLVPAFLMWVFIVAALTCHYFGDPLNNLGCKWLATWSTGASADL